MRRVKISLLAGLMLLMLAIVLTLAQSPLSVASSNKVANQEATVASTTHGATYCQANEPLPAHTSAIRIWLDAAAGPHVNVVVSSGGRAITDGSRGSNWTGGSVTVPVKPLSRAVKVVTVCVSFHLHDETVLTQGSTTPAAFAAHEGRRALAGRMWIEYLRPGSRSWASLVPEIVRHMSFGHAVAGTWIVYAILVLLIATAAIAANVVLTELR